MKITLPTFRDLITIKYGLLPPILFIIPFFIVSLMLLIAGVVTSLEDAHLLFRDPASIIWRETDIDVPYISFFSQLGSALWFMYAAFTGVIALLRWQVKALNPDLTILLSVISLTVLLLGIDDLLLLHDRWLPQYFGIGDQLLRLYVVGATFVSLLFWRQLYDFHPLWLALIAFCFGVSLMADLGSGRLEDLTSRNIRIFIEDGFKFLGIVALCMWCLRVSLLTGKLALVNNDSE